MRKSWLVERIELSVVRQPCSPADHCTRTQAGFTLNTAFHFSIYPNCVPEQNRFSVISEPPTLSLSRNIPGPLWAGIDQEMVLSVFTGSFSIEKVSHQLFPTMPCASPRQGTWLTRPDPTPQIEGTHACVLHCIVSLCHCQGRRKKTNVRRHDKSPNV